MKRISTATSVPNKFGAGKNGFTNGNVVGGVPSTDLEDVWFDNLQEEVANVIEAIGIALDGNDKAQLLKALRSNLLLSAVDTGAANACVINYTPANLALSDNMVLWFKAKATNTGATTLNVDGLGAKPIVGGAHAALQGGEIVANGKCQVVWNTTLNSWVLIECTGAALQVGPAVASQQAVQLSQMNGSVGSAAGGYLRFPFIDSGGVKRNLTINYGLLGIACTTPGTVGYYGAATITWPAAFSSTLLCTVLSSQDQTGAAPYLTTWQSPSLTGITIMPHASGSVGNINCSYLSIGF